VQPLSIWDSKLDGGLLWERLGRPRADALRREGRAENEIGTELAATALAALRVLRERHPFERAFVGGGLTRIAGFAQELRERAELPLELSADGCFAGERGGLALLRASSEADGIVVDVGQTALKASCRGHRLVRERDLGALPLELIDPAGAPPLPEPHRLQRAAAFIGDAIAEVAERTVIDGGGLVLALPCPLDDACVPGPCTYGWQGEARLVPAILERSGLHFRDVFVLNDAELAAETALALRPPRAGERVFVLTLGFGPGGALIG